MSDKQDIKAVKAFGSSTISISIETIEQNKKYLIYTDSGRIQRPLFIMDNNKLVIKKKDIRKLSRGDNEYNFSDLLKEGLVEFLDVEEEETAMIQMFIENRKDKEYGYCFTYTHCEIHPALMLGICATMIPYANHNQAPVQNISMPSGNQMTSL